jgi:HSP90 family molecular chaperone
MCILKRTVARDYADTPIVWEHFTAEGNYEFKSILYIPGSYIYVYILVILI